MGLFPRKPTPRLYDHLIGVLRVRHHSRRTEEAYVHGTGRYIQLHRHQHPRELAESDVNRFLSPLAVQEHVAASTQNQALSARHTFRDCCAAHLLAGGHDIRTVRELLGPKDVRRTMIHTDVFNRGGRGLRSPADRLGHRADER